MNDKIIFIIIYPIKVTSAILIKVIIKSEESFFLAILKYLFLQFSYI